MQPALILLEYFPFGRETAALYLAPFLEAVRERAARPRVVSSTREIGERQAEDQPAYDRRVVRMANRLIDAVLVHGDTSVLGLTDTFSAAGDLSMPVFHTGYVVPGADAMPPSPPSSAPCVVVSAGSGRGCLPLLKLAIAAQRADLGRDFTMRVFGGLLLADSEWRDVEAAAAGVPGVELIRQTENLAAQIAAGTVSLSRAGYNTVLDVVRAGRPAVVVPFVPDGDDEQRVRAQAFEARGVLRADRKSTRLNSSHVSESRMPSSA